MDSDSLMSVSNVAPTLVEELQPGHHICCLYKTEQEHRDLVTQFMLDGLDQNQKVAYIMDVRDAEIVKGYLLEAGVDPAPYVDSGQLVFLTHDETYTKGGVFDPDRMIETLGLETQQALDTGFSALRVTGEMTWALRNLSGTDRLIEYEAKLNDFFPNASALAICQYDQRRFPPETLIRVLDTHPIAVAGNQLFDNFYYMPPDQYLSTDRPLSELDLRIRNLQHHQRAEHDLRESESRHRQVLEKMGVGLVVHAPDTSILFSNERALELLGLTEEQVNGKLATEGEWSFVREDGSKMPIEDYPVHQVLSKGSPLRDFVAGIDRPGDLGRVWVSVVAFPVLGDDEKVRSVVTTCVDITEKRAAEERLRQSLSEKDNLLREIHHRVKNTLQVASSLLSLQAREADSEEVVNDLNEAARRIRGMALVHEKLYQSADLANVEFSEFLKEMVNQLFDSCGLHTGRIELKTEMQPVSLAVDEAVVCGQIASELLSNAIKHAFPEGSPGSIRVSIRPSGQRGVELQVSDDGIGLPQETAAEDPKSLGMWLVKAFTEQLGGQVQYDTSSGAGTDVRVNFQRS